MKIGLLCGREFSFPPAFLDRVNQLGAAHGITAEFLSLTGTKMGEPSGYRVIVDRISHEVEYFRAYLKHAVLEGTYVINNPFWWTADDKFFNYSVAQKLGVAVPKTVLLPQKGYPADVDLTAESLPLAQDSREPRSAVRGREEHVQEARAGDLGALDLVHTWKMRQDRLGNLSRRTTV